MFLAEAGKAMTLDHPGIVRTYSIEKSDGYLAIVQQFVDGPDLKTAWDQPRSQKDVARLIEKVAEAVAYAHQRGIFHRDLKPGNILIDRQGQPYVADFGLALNASEQIYLPKQRCGTVHYMPPEQVAGLTRLLDGRSDIWSLGVILYELLTKRRPFDGLSVPDVFEQIENKDPRPPRQIDDSIDPELQRICLKCLERQQKNRYPTADELAADLRHWAGQPKGQETRVETTGPFIPKGLRSYSAEDAAFFLDLLPGPRDRDGIPGSIRFWKSRICEPVAAANRVPVGIIIGPSGSGKSSYIKAGLLPQLGSETLALYVEATQADTEVRLFKTLRQHFHDIPDDVSLPDLFRGLSQGQWRGDAPIKLLIVIDQFEQRLSQADQYETSQLAKALRYCDGQQLQCLLLTRDDFMMALSRFCDALETDVREGVNTQTIDLFDRKHACNVLTKLGRAYGQLPAEPEELSDGQQSFVKEAVNQLSDHESIICVRLTLFAEMFRHRAWTLAELKLVGGVAGTGEKFLEATFGPAGRDKRLRQQREPVQRVLERLLPAAGTDIRGSMKPESELAEAAQLMSQPGQFDELIKSLDGQLKLITRTDPDTSGTVDADSSAGNRSRAWFQLTHDYLVPSIRGWLDTTLKTSRAGRAKLRLRELAAQTVPGQPPRNLPTNLEWVTWQVLIPPASRNSGESQVMQSAGRRFVRQAGLAAMLLVILGAIAGYLVNENRVQQLHDRVQGLVDNLIGQEISNSPAIVSQLAAFPELAKSRLLAVLENPALNDGTRLRVAMGLLPFDPEQSGKIVEAVTDPECSPEQLVALIQVLDSNGIDSSGHFLDLAEKSSAHPGSRFRAICAEILLNDDGRDWTPNAGTMATVLFGEPITTIDSWLAILQEHGEQFEKAFSDLLGAPDDPLRSYFLDSNNAFVLASSLYAFAKPVDRWTKLAGFIPASNDVRFNAILSAFERHGTGDSLADALEKLVINPNDEVGRANQAVALMRLGRRDKLLELYGGDFDSRPTLWAINFSGAPRLRLHDLRTLYEDLKVAENKNVNLRRSVLQALALQAVNVVDDEHKSWLGGLARHHILNDVDACCFSTSELITRRLGSNSIEGLRAERRKQRQNGTDVESGNVLIDYRLQAFSVVNVPDGNGSQRRLAVSTSELTTGEIRQYLEESGIDLEEVQKDKRTGSVPFNNFTGQTGMLIVLSYCNSLSEDRFYPEELSVDNIYNSEYDPANAGYRLPTTDEWLVSCESNRVLEGPDNTWPRVATNYAWVFENSQNKVRDRWLASPQRGRFV